jgi:exoribonuclease-2
MVGIADVDAFVPKGSPIDDHAAKETTSVYTGVRTFPMLPEQLSNDASSLLENQDRPAMVIEFVVSADGTLSGGKISLYVSAILGMDWSKRSPTLTGGRHDTVQVGIAIGM